MIELTPILDGLSNFLTLICKEDFNADNTQLKLNNCLNPLIQNNIKSISSNQFISKIVFMCLFPSLNSKNESDICEILKTVSMIFTTWSHWKLMMQLRYDIPLIKALYNLKNEKEFKYVVGILGKALKICPNLIPLSIINCLCSISLDSNYQKYSQRYNYIGILSYICLRCPLSLKFTDIVDTLASSCLDENRNVSLIEYTVSVLLYIFEDPNLRSSIFEKRLFENILTPFTDQYFVGYKDNTDDNFEDSNHKFCSLSLVILRIILRSWTGIALLFNSENGFKSLIKILPYSSSSTQGFTLNLLFDMFFIEYPDECPDFNKILSNLHPYGLRGDCGVSHSDCAINELFMVLKPIRKNAIDILSIYKGFLVQACVSSGVIEALLQTIFLSKEIFIKHCSTIILAEIMSLYYSITPANKYGINHLEQLLNQHANDFVFNIIEIKSIISNIDSYVSWKHNVDISPFLSNISSFCLNSMSIFPIESEISKIDSKQFREIKKIDEKNAPCFKEAELENEINASRVLSSPPDRWSWEKIKNIFLKYPDILVEFESEQPSYKFMLMLKLFFTPNRSTFFSIKANTSIAKLASTTLFLFFKSLLSPLQGNKGLQWVNEFLVNFSNILNTYNPEEDLDAYSNSATAKKPISFAELHYSMQDCLSKEYFTLIGFIQNHKIGQAFIDASLVLNKIYSIIETIQGALFIKAVIPCMKYTHSLCQNFITVIVHSNNKEAKLFCIKFIKVHCRLHEQKVFMLNCLLKMLYDLDENVRNKAVNTIDEIIDNDNKLCNYILNSNMQYRSFNTIGVQILSRILSNLSTDSPSFHLLQPYFQYLANEWSNKFISFYTKSLQLKLQSFFSTYENDRIHDSKNLKIKFLKEMYLNTYRLHRFINIDQIPRMFDISKLESKEDSDILKQKLLFIANFASTSKGVKKILRFKENIFEKIIQIAYNCPYLSVRWISLIGLNIISRKSEGAKILESLGWKICYQNYFPSPETFIFASNEISPNYNVAAGSLTTEFPFKMPPPSSTDNEQKLKTEESTTDCRRESVLKFNRESMYSNRVRSASTLSSLLTDEKISVLSTSPNLQTNEEDNPLDNENNVIFFENSSLKSVSLYGNKNRRFNDISDERQDRQNCGSFVCLPLVIENFFNVAMSEEYLKENTKLPDISPLCIFDGNLNELCEGISEKCFSCSVSMWSRSLCQNNLIPCENLQGYEAFNGREMLRGTKNKWQKTNLLNDFVNEDEKMIHNEIIAIFFNTISQTMYKNGITAISKLKKKFPKVFENFCLMKYIVDQSITHNFKPNVCNSIFNSFDTCNLNCYFKVAQKALSCYLIDKTEI